jgi:hypothetical protein
MNGASRIRVKTKLGVARRKLGEDAEATTLRTTTFMN